MRGHWDPDEAERFLQHTYRPHTNTFWYGTVCGFCLATSVAAFAAATHYLGVW